MDRKTHQKISQKILGKTRLLKDLTAEELEKLLEMAKGELKEWKGFFETVQKEKERRT